MLVFKKISYKNFLSTGNKPIEIDLDTTKVTVISGKNGNGKSSLAEAIFFAIYGKSFRKVNKESLINSINKKNLLVILDIEVNGTLYTIKRGIKPNIFEIYVNGVLKPQTANVKDYQKWLQGTVLKMDEKTFKQVVTMGSSSYIPFMRLTASERRTVIEDLLNIDIISQMNMIAKKRAGILNDDACSVEIQIVSTNSMLESIKLSASTIKENIEESIRRIDNELGNIKKESELIIAEITELKSKSDPQRYDELTNIQKQINKYISDGNNLLYQKQHALKLIIDDLKFFSDKTECPYCTQALSKDFLSKKQDELHSKEEKEQSDIDEINRTITSLLERGKAVQSEMDNLYAIELQISKKYEEIENLKQRLKFFLNEKETCVKKQSIESEQSANVAQQYEETLASLKEQQSEIASKQKAYGTIFALLKDDGIKTVIIKNYLGIINALIKKYLNIIGYNVSFSFDANFNETIKSRGRDTFEYNCFSEGERLRIDFCLLFTFRELAKLRSTVNTNLLIIDEQDGRLDTDGVSAINTLLSTMPGNLIIISQYADIYDEIATRQIVMEKEQHFTRAIVL